MPRQTRNVQDGYIYHVLNRGNGKQTIFHKDSDYRAFKDLMKKATDKFPIKIYAFCLMPNHFHFVLSPDHAIHLSNWMHWITTVHAPRHHYLYKTSGHIWQGRFKSILVQNDGHLITVLRYVEGNPVRAGLVNLARRWPWSSHRDRLDKSKSVLLDEPPVRLFSNWERFVNLTMKPEELHFLRECIKHQLPFGTEHWRNEISRSLGIKTSLKPRGRPKKEIIGDCP